MTSATVQPGDVYCTYCLSERISMHLLSSNSPDWDCEGCGRTFTQPFHADENGRFAWTWSDEHPRPNPGCPWCGTCNIRGVHVMSRGDGQFVCLRRSCGKTWRGGFTATRFTQDGPIRMSRWTIRVPVSEIPWVSGTLDDLECYRRCLQAQRFGDDSSSYFPQCCRWPKSCSAFDPGFTVGKGRTTLPVVWFDGFGWRSGPPDATKIPQHLFDEMWARWNHRPGVREEEANDDDDGDDYGTQCDCSRCR